MEMLIKLLGGYSKKEMASVTRDYTESLKNRNVVIEKLEKELEIIKRDYSRVYARNRNTAIYINSLKQDSPLKTVAKGGYVKYLDNVLKKLKGTKKKNEN